MTLTNVHTDFEIIALDFQYPECKVHMEFSYQKFADLTANIPGDLHEKARVYVRHMSEIAEIIYTAE